MNPYLLIDFGSTYTKMTAVDLDKAVILGTARSLTTVSDGLVSGYWQARQELRQKTGELKFKRQMACSSAAGGLKMIAIGLVPELTVEAAKRAALGAGARVIKTYSYRLTKVEIEEILKLAPDLILLVGGTDGGNREVILHNARMLKDSLLVAPVIIAGNKEVTPEIEDLFKLAGKISYSTANVLPSLNILQVEPVRQTIREIFLKRIIQAKGLDQIETLIDGIVMPTPSSVLQAATCLADGSSQETGLGELLLIDIGGATTDVHSIAEGLPRQPQICLRGLPEPRIKRTVEGDLGLRVSAMGLVEAVSLNVIKKMTGFSEEAINNAIILRAKHPDYLPQNEEEWKIEETLSFLAIKQAAIRHAGHLEQQYTPDGKIFIQVGKDLADINNIIGTGGVLTQSVNCPRMMEGVFRDSDTPDSLLPVTANLWFDRDYTITTLGLLVGGFPEIAFRLLKKSLVKIIRTN